MAVYDDSGLKTFVAGSAMDAYRRVKFTSEKLAYAGAEDKEIGVLEQATFADLDPVVVRLKNKQGTKKMVAAGSFSIHANLYGAANGMVDDVVNSNFIGIALDAASGANSIVEVLEQVSSTGLEASGDITGNLTIDEDFAGDWPAAGTAIDGPWTKTETNGLGVTSVDGANGQLIFAFDAVAEAATATLFMENSPIDPSKGGVFECILAVYDIGDDVALDIDFGLASDDHATDFEAIAEFVAFHLNGANLSLLCHSDDGAIDTAPVDTTVDLVDDTFYAFKIDFSDLADVKFYYKTLTAASYTRVAAATTFDVSESTANWTPIVMVEKTNNDTTADVRVDRIRVQVSDPR